VKNIKRYKKRKMMKKGRMRKLNRERSSGIIE